MPSESLCCLPSNKTPLALGNDITFTSDETKSPKRGRQLLLSADCDPDFFALPVALAIQPLVAQNLQYNRPNVPTTWPPGVHSSRVLLVERLLGRQFDVVNSRRCGPCPRQPSLSGRRHLSHYESVFVAMTHYHLFLGTLPFLA